MEGASAEREGEGERESLAGITVCFCCCHMSLGDHPSGLAWPKKLAKHRQEPGSCADRQSGRPGTFGPRRSAQILDHCPPKMEGHCPGVHGTYDHALTAVCSTSVILFYTVCATAHLLLLLGNVPNFGL